MDVHEFSTDVENRQNVSSHLPRYIPGLSDLKKIYFIFPTIGCCSAQLTCLIFLLLSTRIFFIRIDSNDGSQHIP